MQENNMTEKASKPVIKPDSCTKAAAEKTPVKKQKKPEKKGK
jgi:hypothetical protein